MLAEPTPQPRTLPHRLCAVNGRLRGGRLDRFARPLVFSASLVLLIGYAAASGRLLGPPRNPDGVAYDAIGVGLAEGHGFAAATDSPTFRDPYVVAGRGNELPPPRPPQTTAMRPPVLPMMLAAVHRLGSHYVLIRLLAAVAVAGSTAIAAGWVRDRCGLLPALTLLPALALVADYRTREMSRVVLTEPFALLLVTAAADRLVAAFDRRRLHDAWAAGVLLGLAGLMRTAVVLWIPPLAVLLLAFCGVRSRRVTAAAVVAALVVVSPWMIRNAVVTGSPAVLGTQGSIELPAGYSDAAWLRRGRWHQDSRPPLTAATLVEEVAAADEGRRLATDWIAANPLRASLLAPLKVIDELGPHAHGDVALWLLALVGWVAVVRDPLRPVSVAILLSCLVAVAATWSVGGRFLWPTASLLHAVAACGLWHGLTTGHSDTAD